MSILYHVEEKSKKWQREWICKQTRRSLLWLKFQPQIDTSSETVFSRLMSDLGGQMSCWQIPDDPARLYYTIVVLLLYFLDYCTLHSLSRGRHSRMCHVWLKVKVDVLFASILYYITDARPTYIKAKWFKKVQY